MNVLFTISAILSLFRNEDRFMQPTPYSYLALGDSYTIGESVAAADRWPMQLTERLREAGIDIEDPTIVATTGWTTDELEEGIRQAKIDKTYSIVSLLIGVNNQYRGYDVNQYENEFEKLLDQAILFAGGDAANVFVISIPDYGVTPFSKEKGLDQQTIARELDTYNALAERITKRKKASFTDITLASKEAGNDLDLLASDGLHPSGKMYAQWVDKVYPSIYQNLFSR